MNKNLVTGIIIIAGIAVVFLIDSMQPVKKPVHQHTTAPVTQTPPLVASKATEPLGRGVPKGNLGALNVAIPSEWIQGTPSTSMRLAQYKMPGTAVNAGDAELAVFNRIGGTVQQNLDRWVGQFSQADGSSSRNRAEFTKMSAGIYQVDRVYLEGSYSAGMMGGSPAQNPNYGLLGYIVNMPDGAYYFKAVGPVETIKYWTTELDNFIGNIKISG